MLATIFVAKMTTDVINYNSEMPFIIIFRYVRMLAIVIVTNAGDE